jgi:hypothetical protein
MAGRSEFCLSANPRFFKGKAPLLRHWQVGETERRVARFLYRALDAQPLFAAVCG